MIPALALATLLIAVLCDASAAEKTSGTWPNVTRLRDGSTVSVSRTGHVVERSPSGKVKSDSFCGSYTRYARWVRFFATFRTAVLTQDHFQVATMVASPFSWNHGPPWHTTSIQSTTQLLGVYRQVFTPSIVHEIKLADPRALFCKNVSQVSLGEGVAWGDDPHGRLAITSINTDS